MDWDISGSTEKTFNTNKTSAMAHSDIGFSDSVPFDGRDLKKRAQLGLVLASLVIAALVGFSGCDAESLFGGNSGSTDAALRILDPSATVLLHINVEKGIETLLDEFPPSSSQKAAIESAMYEITEKLGMNPKEDFNHVFMALSGISDRSDSTFMPNVGMVVLAEFDQDVLESRLEGDSEFIKLGSAGKHATYQLEGQSAIQFSLVEGKMMLLSNNAAYLDRMTEKASDSGAPLAQKDALQKQIGKLDNWLVVRDLDLILSSMDGNELEGQLARAFQVAKTVKSVAVGLNTAGSDLEGTLLIQPSEGVEAADIASLISGLRATLRTQLQDNPELLEELEDIEIGTVKGLVKISAASSKDDLKERLKGLATSVGKMVQQTAKDFGQSADRGAEATDDAKK